MPTTPTYYSGQGMPYLTVGTAIIGFQPEGVNGAVTCAVEEKTTPRGSALYGEMLETFDDATGRIGFTPFDDWTLIPYLYPAWTGVDTSAIASGAAAVLKIGTNPHDPTNAGTMYPGGIWTVDGRQYAFVRCGWNKHPAMKFGAGEKLFGAAELLALGDPTKLPGATGFLMTGNAITESGAANPNTLVYAGTNFAQTHWTGAWGGVTGFDTLEAEDGWDLVADVKYQTFASQRITRVSRMTSTRFMLKGRLVGPTHTKLVGAVLAHTSGQVMQHGTVSDFTLTSGTRTVVLHNTEIRSAPFEFGGTKLNTGEVGFVTSMQFTAGAPTALVTFSA